LVRVPYTTRVVCSFVFKDPQASSGYLWGNAAYAFCAVLMRAFANYGWLAHIRGNLGHGDGGNVPPAVRAYFSTDQYALMQKFNTDVLLSDAQELELAKLGFIALCQAYGGKDGIFYSNSSIQQMVMYKNSAAQQNAKAATMLQYIFCASRFGHYLKIIGRDKIGSFIDAQDCQNYLMCWLLNYIAGNSDLSHATRACYPLQEARVQVKENVHKRGAYLCVIYLKPYFQLEQMVTAITLVTELKAGTAF
jgi:type VI secretion system protein ImpD